MSRGWAKASAPRLQITLTCAVLCHIVSLQYLSRSSLRRLAGVPCRLFHFGLCGCKFVLCLLGQCPGLCTICHSWQHTGVVHLSLQADGKVAFEDIPVFGVCRPACHDSSLYLFVLVLFIEAVVLSQVQVAWDIFYQHIVHVYRGVVYNHHLCICDVHLKTHSSTFIG